MPVSKKRESLKKPARVQSKRFLLPMPRSEADALCLQSRLALEAARANRASLHESTVLAQTVLLTGFLTKAGHGLLDLAFVLQVGEEVLAIVDAGKPGGEWIFSETIIESLITIVNAHDRQLREVRFGEVQKATQRLDRMIGAAR